VTSWRDCVDAGELRSAHAVAEGVCDLPVGPPERLQNDPDQREGAL
jgi:hypothetical protein